MDINIELASPSDFIPELPGWRDRSVFIQTYDNVSFYHYDFYAQALSKIQRGHDRDLRDVRNMHADGLIELARLSALFEEIAPSILRYPSWDEDAFRHRVSCFISEEQS